MYLKTHFFLIIALVFSICQPAIAGAMLTSEQQNSILLDEKTQAALVKLMGADEETKKRVYNNTASEAAYCWAFYTTEGVCAGMYDARPPSDVDKALAKDVYASILNAQKIMLGYAQFYTKLAGLMPETIEARAEQATQYFKETIKGNCGNFSVLMKETGATCKEAAEQSTKRLAYWYGRLRQ